MNAGGPAYLGSRRVGGSAADLRPSTARVVDPNVAENVKGGIQDGTSNTIMGFAEGTPRFSPVTPRSPQLPRSR